MHLQNGWMVGFVSRYRPPLFKYDKHAVVVGAARTIDALVPPPQQQGSQQQQQQADAHAAHYQARVVLLLRQRHLTQMSDGVRLPPLEEAEGFMVERHRVTSVT